MTWYMALYVVVGCFLSLAVLLDVGGMRKKERNGESMSSAERRLMDILSPPVLLLFIAFLLLLWPVALGMVILYKIKGEFDDSDDDNTGDPQSRVPPEYR